MSSSLHWRHKGNAFYTTVTAGLCWSIVLERLTKSIGSYSNALRMAQTKLEESSANKNLALATWKLSVRAADQWPSKRVSFHYLEALKYFRDANRTCEGQSLSWIEGLRTSAIFCFNDFSENVFHLDMYERVSLLEKAALLVIDRVVQTETYIDIMNSYFHSAISAMQKKNYKRSLSLLHDCYFPLNEARRLNQSADLVAEIELLEKDVFIQTCVAEATQAVFTGDELLAQVVLDEEVLNMDMVWEVTDWYRKAIMLTREHDFEIEAISLSRLGHIYHILLMKEKAKMNFTKSLHFANLMVPRVFHDQDWYILATSTLQRYQAEAVREADEKKQQEYTQVKEEIKEDLKKVAEAFKSSTKMEFLHFLYKNYKPKNSLYKNVVLAEKPDMADWKKLLCKAVTYYHPDKVDVSKHGLAWKVLSEEITKFLTQHYEVMKL